VGVSGIAVFCAEETYGIGEGELTQWRPWSLPALRKEFNAVPPLVAWSP
jgi:hypothetical protein